MAKNVGKNQSNQVAATELSQEAIKSTPSFILKYPLLILSAIVVILYMGSINFGFTELDDTIFIVENHTYNEDLSNLVHSFKRGVFSEGNDTYYRPMLLNSFVLNDAMSGANVKGYHAMNVIFHLIAVLLLFIVLKRNGFDKGIAFLLTFIFAIHPVLSQAVAWIPGRNDTLLAVFSFSFMLFASKYLQTRQWKDLVLQFLFLLFALFTKESGVFVAPAFMLLCLCNATFVWKDSKNYILYGSWFLGILCWFGIRSMATLRSDPIQLVEIAKHFLIRLSLSIQYLGKIILPFNLSVFPMLNETSYLFGIAAVLIIVVLLYFTKDRNMRIVFCGLGWFFLFLIPLFILPSALNDQDFEHRLYLPIVGVLIILSQTLLFNAKNLQRTSLWIFGISVILFGINMLHQQKFKDPISFWSAAVETTPNSSYANMMLAARLKETDSIKADEMMHKAFRLNPKEKYVNYYLGKDYLNQNLIDSAEKYLLNELEGSKYYDTYFLMSRVSFLKGDTSKSIEYMGAYLEKDPSNSQAINNYVLMLTQSNQWAKAQEFIRKKQAENIMVPKALVDLANGASVK